MTLHRSGGITLTPKMECTDAEQLTIGELGRLTGLPVKRIHYYERRGLLEPTSRSKAGYRLYGREEVARLEFIKRAKLLGLTLEEIRELVELAARYNEGQILSRLEDVPVAKLRETAQKIEKLSAFREKLVNAAACLATSAAAAIRKRGSSLPATGPRLLDPGPSPSCPYSPECLEGWGSRRFPCKIPNKQGFRAFIVLDIFDNLPCPASQGHAM